MVWCGGGGVRRSLTVHGLAFEESESARARGARPRHRCIVFLDGYFYNQDHHQEEEKEIFEK